jgi:hypothetical protein
MLAPHDEPAEVTDGEGYLNPLVPPQLYIPVVVRLQVHCEAGGSDQLALHHHPIVLALGTSLAVHVVQPRGVRKQALVKIALLGPHRVSKPPHRTKAIAVVRGGNRD